MRLLHTSDWHLGQHFMGRSRQREHEAFLDWLETTVKTQAVDVVLVAGDIFDTATPPSQARELYNRFVVAMHRAGVMLVLLGGNHDSVAVLNEGRDLLACLSTHVIATVQETLAAQVITLPCRDGSAGAILCAVPYLRPRDLLTSQADESASDKATALQQAISQHYQALYDLALDQQARYRQSHGRQLPIIASGHLMTVGSSRSESVREIYVGSLEALPVTAFPPVDYLALGHIHRPQAVGGATQCRYSGSPLPLSFDEAEQEKQVLLVTLESTATHCGLQQVEALPVPCFQPLMAVRGSLLELETRLPHLAADYSAQHGGDAPPLWLEIIVREDDYLADLQTRLQALTKGLPLDILRLRRERTSAPASLSLPEKHSLDELSPEDVFSARLQQETLPPELGTALTTRYRQIVEQLQEDVTQPISAPEVPA